MSHQTILTTPGGIENRRESKPKGGIFLVERRKHPRISVALPFDYSPVEEEGSFRGIAEDASEGGLLVYLLEKVEIGAFLKVEIFFSRGTELATIQAIAKVVWCDLATRENWAEYQYGIQFQSFFKGDLNRLKILLKEIGQSRG